MPDLSSSLSANINLLIPVLVSLILGSILGWQRVHWGKAAGLRTYALVAAGSALFTVLSISAFGADTARVASAVVTGIGFLGAGTILHREDRVEGLTTAAGLWMVAAIGMGVAVGYYALSIIITAVVLFLLTMDDRRFKR